MTYPEPADPAGRLFPILPAIYRNRDETGDLARLLRALAQYLLTGAAAGDPIQAGLEQYLDDIPTLFAEAPRGATGPDRFAHWLAAWLAFTPHALFEPPALRRIMAGIVPLYGYRGSRDYLVRLLTLCFPEELAVIHVDDRPRAGLTLGQSVIGVDSQLSASPPFSFRVHAEFADGHTDPDSAEALCQKVRAIIEFAKPAHTLYELVWRRHDVSGRPESAARVRPTDRR
jgi:phage tail-like protein